MQHNYFYIILCSINLFQHIFWPKLQVLSKFEQNISTSCFVSQIHHNDNNNIHTLNLLNPFLCSEDLKTNISGYKSTSICSTITIPTFFLSLSLSARYRREGKARYEKTSQIDIYVGLSPKYPFRNCMHFGSLEK